MVTVPIIKEKFPPNNRAHLQILSFLMFGYKIALNLCGQLYRRLNIKSDPEFPKFGPQIIEAWHMG